MNKKLLFVYNPIAGRGTIRLRLSSIIGVMENGGYDVTVHSTKSAEDIHDTIANEAASYDLVVAAGGDGTINEAVSGIAEVDDAPPFGIMPAGSTNDFATSLGIPKNPVAAAEMLISGKEQFLDLGVFNGRYYIYVAGFGLFSDISYTTDQNFKQKFGFLAYLLMAGKELFNVPEYEIRYETGGRSETGRFIYGMITNSHSVAGIKNLPGRDVIMDDGLFEVTLVRNLKNPLELGEAIVCLLTGEPTSRIVRIKTDQIRLVSSEPIAWTLDGEDGGIAGEAEIKVLKRKLRLIVPKNFQNLPEIAQDDGNKE